MKKILIRIEIVLICLLLFFSLALILSRSILPNHGIYIYSEINGESMNPTIVEGALIVGKYTPYEELQVGDIITVRMRKEYRFSSSSTTSNLTKGSVTETTEDCAQAGQADQASIEGKKIEYLDDTITHRIVSIEDDGFLTRGDNENSNDYFPVTPDGYLAKVIWWNNYLGWPFKIMYEYRGLIGLAGIVAVFGGIIVILLMKDMWAAKNMPE